MNTGFRQHRHAVDRLLEHRFEVLDVLGQLVEAEIFRDALHAPGLGFGLEGPEQHLACILLVVGPLVRHPEHRQLAKSLDGFGDDVEVLAGMERNVDSRHRAKVTRPHARTVHHDVAGDTALARPGRPGNPGHPSVLPVDVRHSHAFGDPHASLACSGGQGLGDIGGIALAVQGKMHGADDIGNIEPGIEFLHLASRNLVDVDAEGAGKRGGPVDLLLAVPGQRHRDGAVLPHARGNAGLFLELHVKVGGILRESRHVLA